MKTAEQTRRAENSPSACADAARKLADERVAHLSPRQRDEHRERFNARLVALIDSGRILK